MAHLLGGDHLHLEFPAKLVLDDVTVGIADGDRVGIVGRNGDGKSSLMKILTGLLEPDDGRVTRRGGLRVGMLAQDDDLPGAGSVRDTVVGSRPEHEWRSDARIRDVLDGLLGDLDLAAAVDALSGGQRRRVSLARLLIGEWDVIALDEPTNHLDIEGIAWLAAHLQERWSAAAGALLLVTHDRWFLDAVCTRMWEVHDAEVEPFEGGYAAYILQRVERQRQNVLADEKRQNLLRKELAWLRRGAPARTTKPKFRLDAATQLIENEPAPRDGVQLAQLATARLGKDVVDLLEASVTYPAAGDAGATEVLRGVQWRIAPGERTGVLGPNGAGKSTLLGLIAGAVAPTGGRVKRGTTVRVASLTQRLSELDELVDLRVREVLALQRTSYITGGRELTPAQLLERLGFRTSELTSRVRDLSGGQKRRLQLLLVLLAEPNVLILDEPSNDLDTDMLAALEDLLDSWPGTLLVVSHDRYLLERVTDNQYAIFDGRLRHLPGGVDEYLRLRTEERSIAAQRTLTPTVPGAGAGTRTSVLAGSARRSTEKELAAVDRRLSKLATALADIDVRLAESHDDFARLLDLQSQRETLTAEMTAVEDRWLELGEALGH